MALPRPWLLTPPASSTGPSSKPVAVPSSRLPEAPASAGNPPFSDVPGRDPLNWVMSYALIASGLGVSIDLPGGPLPVRMVLGIGLNYAKHAAEQGGKVPERPVVFAKNIASVTTGGRLVTRSSGKWIVP